MNSFDIVNKAYSTQDYIKFGKALHSVQDFYAHSNYIELFIEYYKKQNNGKTPSSLEILTMEEANGIPIYSGFKEVLKKSLETGEFHLEKYKIGQDVDYTHDQGNTHHDDIAKDSPEMEGSNTMPGVDLFNLALEVAYRDTRNATTQGSSRSK